MNIDPVLIYLILFTLSSLVLLIVGLLIAYLNLLNRYSKTKKSSAVDDDISPMFRDTEARLKSIVDNASAQAAQTISSTQYFTEKQLKIFELFLSKILGA